MTQQRSLILTGNALKAEGCARVLANTPESWKLAARSAIEELARTGSRFTANDLTGMVGMPPKGKMNAVGAMFAAASKAGLIRRVGQQPGSRLSQRGREIRVWVGKQAAERIPF